MCLAKVNDVPLLGWEWGVERWAAATLGLWKADKDSGLSHCGLCTSLPHPPAPAPFLMSLLHEGVTK